MVPATYPTNSSGQMVISTVSTPVAAERWLTWIPVKVNASPTISTGIYGTTDNIEGIPIEQADPTGLQEWVDYIPVSVVVDDDANAWETSAAGFIPVIGTIT